MGISKPYYRVKCFLIGPESISKTKLEPTRKRRSWSLARSFHGAKLPRRSGAAGKLLMTSLCRKTSRHFSYGTLARWHTDEGSPAKLKDSPPAHPGGFFICSFNCPCACAQFEKHSESISHCQCAIAPPGAGKKLRCSPVKGASNDY